MLKKTHFKYFSNESGSLIDDHSGLPIAEHDEHGRSTAKHDRHQGPSVDRLVTSNFTAEGPPPAVRLGASDRDRCVAPSKSKPKRRQTIREEMLGERRESPSDWIKWTDESFQVNEVARMCDKEYPTIVKITDAGCSPATIGPVAGQVKTFCIT
jgi:hypothetical protein